MVRPRQLSDAQILDAARGVFLSAGPSASTDTIAEQLGISSAAIFKRFGSKKRLMLAALIPAQPSWFEGVRHGPAPGELRPQLIELAQEVMEFFRGLIPCVSVLRNSGLNETEFFAGNAPPPPLEGARLLGQWFEAAKADGRIREDLDGKACAFVFLGSLHMRVFLAHVTGQPDQLLPDDTHIENIVDLLLKGAEPGGPT